MAVGKALLRQGGVNETRYRKLSTTLMLLTATALAGVAVASAPALAAGAVAEVEVEVAEAEVEVEAVDQLLAQQMALFAEFQRTG